MLVYIKKDLEPYVSLMSPSGCTPDREELWVEIHKPVMKRTYIGIIFRPSGGDIVPFIKTLDNTLLPILGRGNPNNKEVYFLGDFNIDYNRGSDPNKLKIKELEVKYNIRQVIMQPTRVTMQSKSIIDLVFTTIAMNLCPIVGF